MGLLIVSVALFFIALFKDWVMVAGIAMGIAFLTAVNAAMTHPLF
jgi:hypothetical protein